MNRVDRLWAAAILFTNGWIYALPVTDGPLPVFFTPIQIVHGVFLHEALLGAYLFFHFLARSGRLPILSRRAHPIGGLLIALGILGVISSLANLRPLREFAAAGRYFLLVIYFFCTAYWARKFTSAFVLRSFLLGIVCAGAVNLVYTFRISLMRLAGLPLLLGEQGPGGYLGIGVVLGSWLMMERRTRRDAAIAIAALGIGVFAVSISFSKLAMLMAGAGMLAWVNVMFRDLNISRLRKWYALVFVLVAAVFWLNASVVGNYLRSATTFFEYKFRYVDKESIGSRSQYFVITSEILLQHPLFGVGYGGFYDAATATEAYKSPESAKEDPEAGARGESNPHSSFLYYASANGLPGVAVTLLLFGFILEAFRRALFWRGLPGMVLWACLAFVYLIFGLTLPTLFNSSVIYLPAAVALSTVHHPIRGRHRARVRMQAVTAAEPT